MFPGSPFGPQNVGGDHYSATYPGIGTIERASITLSPGIAPAVGTIVTVPERITNLPSVGNFVFTRNGSPVLTFPNCAMVNAKLDWVSQGRRVTLQFADRRYFWQFGHVSGRYNRRHADDTLDTDTEKTPQELAELLLDAMGETGYDVSSLPNDERPSVDWDLANPAAELQTLCDSLACVISFDAQTGNVKLYGPLEGTDLGPGPIMTAGGGINQKAAPTGIAAASARIQFQLRLELEPVALDEAEDGTEKIVPLEDVSYRPKDAQGQFMPFYPDSFFDVEDQFGVKKRQLAERSVYKMYRVKIVDPFNLPQLDLPIADIRRQLNLLNQQAVPSDHTEVVRRAQPRLWGRFIDEWFERNDEYRLYLEGFTIDPERQIVTTSKPVYRFDDQDEPEAAELFLECAFEAKDDNQVWFRRYRSTGTPEVPEIVVRNDVINTIVQEYDDNGQPTTITDNNQDVDLRLDQFRDYATKKYLPLTGLTRQYNGIQVIVPDGKVQQVTLSVGGGAANTLASVGQTHERYIEPPSERNQQELIQRLRIEDERLKAKEARDGE